MSVTEFFAIIGGVIVGRLLAQWLIGRINRALDRHRSRGSKAMLR